MAHLGFDIIDRILTGDGSAYEILKTKMGGQIVAYAIKHFKFSDFDANEIFAQVCYIAYQNRIKHQKGEILIQTPNLEAYMMLTAKYVCLTESRRRDRHLSSQDIILQDAKTPLNDMIVAENILKVRRTLAILGGDCENLLLKHIVEGIKHVDIAVALGKTDEAVRTGYHRCLKKFKELFNNDNTK